MTLLSSINNGDIPTFEEIRRACPIPGLSWHIRMAAFGSIPDAIQVFSVILGDELYGWRIAYDGSAEVFHKTIPLSSFRTVSVLPGHALLLSTLTAAYSAGVLLDE